MQNIHHEIGMLIRDYREKKGITQLDLAKKLGYDTSQFVSLFERGLSKVPTKTLGQLIVILGIPEQKITKSLIKASEIKIKEQISLGKKTGAVS